ncbi:MAG: flagellar export chaperone FliS [Vampirovibrionales bacterium]|nr:flagellar export chaperone FliS [Vampirovibrionales bacterium]
MSGPSAYAKQAQHYKEQAVTTATPEEILIMLYDGAIRFLNAARKGLETGDIEKSHNNLIKTQRIITELMCSLNIEIGGEAAQNLYRLYDYLHYRLVEANLKKDVTMVDEVLGHMRSLRDTWREAIEIALRERAGALNASAPLEREASEGRRDSA